MKTYEKLEIGAGILTLVATSVCFSLYISFILSLESKPSDTNFFTIILILVWVGSLMVAVGAYFNTIDKDKMSLAVLIIGAIDVIAILGFFGFFFFIWGGFLIGLIVFTPVILCISTLLLAFSSE